LESEYWIVALNANELFERKHDDTDGKSNPTQYLSLAIDFMGDVDINIPPGKWRKLRFRTPGGGGKSERVRKALVILAEAIRRDNEEKPES
jgi:hypothetical protein